MIGQTSAFDTKVMSSIERAYTLYIDAGQMSSAETQVSTAETGQMSAVERSHVPRPPPFPAAEMGYGARGCLEVR